EFRHLRRLGGIGRRRGGELELEQEKAARGLGRQVASFEAPCLGGESLHRRGELFRRRRSEYFGVVGDEVLGEPGSATRGHIPRRQLALGLVEKLLGRLCSQPWSEGNKDQEKKQEAHGGGPGSVVLDGQTAR